MKNLFKSIIVPIISLTIVMIGISYFETFVSLRLAGKNLNVIVTGIIYSSYYAGLLLGALYVEKVIQKFGQAHTFILAAASVSTIVLIQSFTHPHVVWILFRLLTGITVAGMFISIESWLLLLFPKSRGTVLAFYMMGLYTAICIGQFGISAAPMDTHHPFNLALIFTTASIIPICFVRKNSPGLGCSEYINVFKLYKKAPLGFAGNLTAGMTLGAFYTLGPVCCKMSSFTMLEISTFMAVTILGGMLMQWPMGKLSDLFQRRAIIMLICSMIFIYSIIGIIVFNMAYSTKLIVQFLFGGMIFTLYPACITYCCDFLPQSGITSVTAAGVVNYGVGSIFGPLIALLFVKTIGAIGFYYYTALLGLSLLIFAIYRQRKMKDVPESSKQN